MKRIHAHWTGGSYKANQLDKQHYHEIIEGDGKVVFGNHPIAANSSKSSRASGTYAAHTLNANTDAIGISVACMGGPGVTEKNFGKYPMTEVQFEKMCERIAHLCTVYDIPVTPKTVLSHAEVEPNLGIKQRGKWDFTVLPFKPELKGAKACGDYMRTRVLAYMSPKETQVIPVKPKPEPEVVQAKPTPVPQPQPKPEPPTFWEWLKSLFGVK